MAIKKALPWVLNILILTFLVLMPFVQSSSSSHIYPSNIAGSRAKTTNIEVGRFRNEAASVGTVEDSARQVPTGPDPLHHNNNPIGP
ncbi:uncharacterized protein LOC133305231 [Gastrolobium bilobum]|uniref:uncharacterized protein LOC133305231 n=1 Tax=Gastrolobium bilobum TaxID=150636 RepID=UPI002AAFB750|nr:uncharacterized protein LOC133305231 [Gastrolobium bilobum]